MTAVGQFEIVLGLLAAVLVLEFAARKLRIPPSSVLVLGGLALAVIPGVPKLELDPDLILLLFLPPLLFAGGFVTAWRDFRADLRVILQLAVGAVAFTTLAVGVAAHFAVPGLPWAACFALGAIVSPPDAVAAKGVLKGVKLPARLITLLDGESLVNDASGLVLYRIAIAAGMTGAFSAWGSLGTFFALSLGGLAVGAVYGRIVVFLLARCTDPELNIAGGLLAAWGAYIIGDLIGVSAVLSTVSGGLVVGWMQHEALPASVRTRARAVWDVLNFLLESLVFILIGLSLQGVRHRLATAGLAVWPLLPPIAGIFGAMVAARFVWIFTTAYGLRLVWPGLRRRDPYPPLSAMLILSWAGMRGVVSLAIALSVPDAFPGRDFILIATLAIILGSLLLQGTTLSLLTRIFRVGDLVLETAPTLDQAEARVILARAAVDTIRRRSLQPDGTERHPRLVEQYTYRVEAASRFAASAGALAPDRQEHFSVILEANHASRAALLDLHRAARIHDSVLHALEAELDLQELTARQALMRGEG